MLEILEVDRCCHGIVVFWGVDCNILFELGFMYSVYMYVNMYILECKFIYSETYNWKVSLDPTSAFSSIEEGI